MPLPSNCPLCGANEKKQAVVTPHVYGNPPGSQRAFFQCNNCDVCYQFPSLSPEEENYFYASEFEKFMSSRSGSEGGWHESNAHIEANESTRIRRMKYIAPHLSERSSILEVGCSSGFMLLPLHESGNACIGIEPSGVFRESVKNRGIEVYESIEGMGLASPDTRFDLILHFFVLEHIVEPLKFLKRQVELLKPGGKIIFEVPNASDPLRTIYDIPEFERFYWSVAHPWYFSEKSLKYLLDGLGLKYELLKDQRYDLSNHMVWARDGKPGGMGRFTEILGEEFERRYKDRLITIGKCDTLIAIIST